MTEHTQSSELNGEDAYRGRELLVESSLLVANTLTRSGLPVEFPVTDNGGAVATYMKLSFDDHDGKILTIQPMRAGTLISLDERRKFETGHSIDVNTSVSLDAEGKIKSMNSGDDVDPRPAIDDLLKVMPLFGNTYSTVEVLVYPGEQT